MKRAICTLFLFCSVTAVSAQDIRIGIELDHNSVLEFENIPVLVSVYNQSDRAVVLEDSTSPSGKPDFRFRVYRKSPVPIERIREEPIAGGLRIPAGGWREIPVDVSRYYDFTSPGTYRLHCEIDWNGKTLASASKALDVIEGVKIKSIIRTMPEPFKSVRVYSLRYWKRAGREHLFLRVDEKGGVVNYGVMDLGPVIRVFAPYLAVDKNGRITVVHQSESTRYTRTVLQSTENGLKLLDRSHHLENGRPHPGIRRRQPTPQP
ncbi:MAG: hypothetical protein R6V03_08690 [Kiritimatiellia bacterium]